MNLDIFPYSLSEEEANDVSWDFKDLYEENGDSKIVAQIDYANIDEDRHIRILDVLDRHEQYLWVNQMIKTDIDKVIGYFSVETFDDLKMLLQINSRELTFCSF